MPKIALKEKINTINFGYIINSIGKIVKIEIKRFCIEKRYSSEIISITVIEVLNNRSLDLLKRVEKSDII